MAFPIAAAAAGAAGYELVEERGLVQTQTAAGWATIIAVAGVAGLVLLLGLQPALQFLIVLALGMAPINYLMRVHAEADKQHGDEAAFWGGARFDF